MKHVLFFMLCLVSLVCNAQKPSVIYDNTQSDGTRTIMCSFVDLNPNDDVKFSVGLGANVTNGVTSYVLIVETKSYSMVTVNEEMKLLLKDKNGGVTTLKAIAVGNINYDTFELDGDYYNIYTFPTFYSVTLTQLQKLSTKGVTKIRQEYSGGAFDKAFNGTEFSWVINEELPLLKEALKTKKSIYSDF